jgi:hypothetical protein
MKKRVVLVFALALIDLPAVAESGVFKCTDPTGVVVYQGVPCKAQSAQVTLVEPRKREPSIANAGSTAANPQESGDGRSVLAGSELIPGMSDTKVLNMRGWGRPHHIVRSRGEDGWREEWTYVARADGATRLVQFVNGKVAGFRSQEAQAIARIEPPRIESQQIVQASPGAQTPTVDAATRAEDAARVVERMTRTEAPSSAAVRWERAAEGNASVSVTEPVAVATQIEAARAEPLSPIAHAAPSAEGSPREPLRVIRTDPPEPVSEAPMHSSAYRDTEYGLEQPAAQ